MMATEIDDEIIARDWGKRALGGGLSMTVWRIMSQVEEHICNSARNTQIDRH